MSLATRIIATLFVGLVAVAAVTAFAAVYRLDETEQAVIIQFGKPIGTPITEPGLHFKLPFVQEVRRFDQRLIIWDGDPNQVPTRGREFISVDTTARWRIADPLSFLKSVRDESGAQSRLDDIIDSVVRDKLSSTELVEIVRSSDWAIQQAEALKKASKDRQGQEPEPTSSATERRDALNKRIEVGREELTRSVLAEARKGVSDYGIELLDVRIKRLNYIPSVQRQVFNRMISERERIAEQFRSEGVGEAAKIRGETQELLAEIRSVAEREAQVLRGQADAEATRIYNEAYGQDPEFFAFYRTLQSFRRTLGEDSVLLLSSDSDYLGFLENLGAYGQTALQNPRPANSRRR